MKLRTVLLTLFLFTGISFQQCSSECECCFDPVLEYFDIEGAEIFHLNMQYSVIPDSSITYEDYGYLNLRLLVEYVAQRKSNFQFSLMSSALACSPPIAGELGSKEEAFTKLEISTINDFDENHMAGESLNDILELRDVGLEPILLSDYLSQLSGNVPLEWFTMKLLNKPTLDSNFQVKVEIELSNGESYTITSRPIEFS